MAYDYKEAVKDDIIEALNEYKDCDCFERDFDKMYELLWMEDSVTGNASGSYTFSRWQAEENLCHNRYLLKDALDYFGYDTILEESESCDVIIRCYLLGELLDEVLQNI